MRLLPYLRDCICALSSCTIMVTAAAQTPAPAVQNLICDVSPQTHIYTCVAAPAPAPARTGSIIPIPMTAVPAPAAQSTPSVPSTPNLLPTGNKSVYLPSFFAAAGSSYNHYAKPATAAGWLSLAMQVGGSASRTYSITTLDITATTSSLRTGLAYILAQPGNFTFLAHLDGGVTTGNASALGSVSGGAMVMYDVGSLFHAPHYYYATGVLRVLASSGTAVQPIVELGFGRTF